MAKYLLDTTVLINYLRGSKEVIQLVTDLAHQGHQLGVCAINVAELYSGLSEPEQAKAEPLIDSLDFYKLTREAAKQAGSYRFSFVRQGISLSVADALIAAVTVEQGATLITANVEDYPMSEVRLLKQP